MHLNRTGGKTAWNAQSTDDHRRAPRSAHRAPAREGMRQRAEAAENTQRPAVAGRHRWTPAGSRGRRPASGYSPRWHKHRPTRQAGPQDPAARPQGPNDGHGTTRAARSAEHPRAQPPAPAGQGRPDALPGRRPRGGTPPGRQDPTTVRAGPASTPGNPAAACTSTCASGTTTAITREPRTARLPDGHARPSCMPCITSPRFRHLHRRHNEPVLRAGPGPTTVTAGPGRRHVRHPHPAAIVSSGTRSPRRPARTARRDPGPQDGTPPRRSGQAQAAHPATGTRRSLSGSTRPPAASPPSIPLATCATSRSPTDTRAQPGCGPQRRSRTGPASGSSAQAPRSHPLDGTTSTRRPPRHHAQRRCHRTADPDDGQGSPGCTPGGHPIELQPPGHPTPSAPHLAALPRRPAHQAKEDQKAKAPAARPRVSRAHRGSMFGQGRLTRHGFVFGQRAARVTGRRNFTPPHRRRMSSRQGQSGASCPGCGRSRSAALARRSPSG